MTFMRIAAFVVAAAVTVAACGGDEPRELTGYRREPAPAVGDLALPDLGNGGDDFELRASPGDLLVVYFGYTNCPDFCPTTLSDLRLATRRLDEADAAKIDVAMVTVDPDRDLPVLDDYITSFFDDGHALGTDDGSLLAQVSAPFGVQYDVGLADDGEIEVAHTTQLYAIDDAGALALTWQFGVTIDDLAADLEQLLEGEHRVSGRQQIALLILVPAVIIGGFVLGRSLDGGDEDVSTGIQIDGADDAVDFEHDYLIPPGTAGRIAAGADVEIVPAELVVRVGDAIRIVNNDSEDHIVGVFFVAAGETLTQRFNSVGVLEGECSVHPSGAFTLRVVA